MSTSEPDAMKEAFAAMAAAFRAKLPEKLDALEAAWQADDSEALVMLCHKLTGSARIYGLQACGEAARALEAAIRDEASRSDTEPKWAALRAALQAATEQ